LGGFPVPVLKSNGFFMHFFDYGGYACLGLSQI
jgi:hypothetical protein